MTIKNMRMESHTTYKYTLPNGQELSFSGLDMFTAEVLCDAMNAHAHPTISRLQRQYQVTGLVDLIETLEAEIKRLSSGTDNSKLTGVEDGNW